MESMRRERLLSLLVTWLQRHGMLANRETHSAISWLYPFKEKIAYGQVKVSFHPEIRLQSATYGARRLHRTATRPLSILTFDIRHYR